MAPPSLPGAPVATRRVVPPIIVFRVTWVNLKKFRLCEAKKVFPPPSEKREKREGREREKGKGKKKRKEIKVSVENRDFIKSRSHLLPGTSSDALHLSPSNRPVKREQLMDFHAPCFFQMYRSAILLPLEPPAV